MCLKFYRGRWVNPPPRFRRTPSKAHRFRPGVRRQLSVAALLQPRARLRRGQRAALPGEPQKDPFPVVEEPEVGLSPEQRPSVPRQSGLERGQPVLPARARSSSSLCLVRPDRAGPDGTAPVPPTVTPIPLLPNSCQPLGLRAGCPGPSATRPRLGPRAPVPLSSRTSARRDVQCSCTRN